MEHLSAPEIPARVTDSDHDAYELDSVVRNRLTCLQEIELVTIVRRNVLSRSGNAHENLISYPDCRLQDRCESSEGYLLHSVSRKSDFLLYPRRRPSNDWNQNQNDDSDRCLSR